MNRVLLQKCLAIAHDQQSQQNQHEQKQQQQKLIFKQKRDPKRSLSTFCSVKKECLDAKLATQQLDTFVPLALQMSRLKLQLLAMQRQIYAKEEQKTLSECFASHTLTLERTKMQSQLQLLDSKALREEASRVLEGGFNLAKNPNRNSSIRNRNRRRNCSACAAGHK